MKLKDLDRAPSGNYPMQNVIRWLRTLLSIPGLTWNGEQRTAALQAVQEAEVLLDADLSPNVTADDLRDATALLKIADELDQALELYEPPDPDPLMRAANALRASHKVLSMMNIRVAFIDWPAEDFWNAGTAEKPHWTADWRDEVRAITAVLHGDVTAPRQLADTLPWNQIPAEHRPGLPAAGEKRLRQLEAAYLQIDDDMTPEHEQEAMTELAALRKFHAAARRILYPKPGDVTVMPVRDRSGAGGDASQPARWVG